ncbi:hypothetical protein EON83_29400 [bacterium]|nr:MAG: hypothetical protein EON83_29400 [bacterium]
MGTFDVTLPEKQRVIFPALCVVCEKENPDGNVELSFLGVKSAPTITVVVDQMISPGTVDSKHYGGNSTTRINGVPVCKGCEAGLKRYHKRLKIGYYTAWIPGGILFFAGVPVAISIPFLLLCAASPGILTLIFPPSFGASFYSNKANFEFKSRKVADEFRLLNDRTLPKKSDSEEAQQA